jgi:hypothetical protein
MICCCCRRRRCCCERKSVAYKLFDEILLDRAAVAMTFYVNRGEREKEKGRKMESKLNCRGGVNYLRLALLLSIFSFSLLHRRKNPSPVGFPAQILFFFYFLHNAQQMESNGIAHEHEHKIN